MKIKPVSCLIIFLVALTFIDGCKKDDTPVPYGSYTGRYLFTITYSAPDNTDTTWLYDGYINHDDFTKQWTIRFLSTEEIYPTIDDNGVMTCPYLVNQQPGWSFSGNIDYNGNVNFLLKQTLIHQGISYILSYTVKGKKKQE